MKINWQNLTGSLMSLTCVLLILWVLVTPGGRHYYEDNIFIVALEIGLGIVAITYNWKKAGEAMGFEV